jgi:soluble lytic murein transglycosylase-like protein
MFDPSIIPTGINSVNKARPSNSSPVQDSFYSVLVKHQVEMIRAWSPAKESSSLDIDPFSISKALLKIKGMTNLFGSEGYTINSQNATQAYVSVKKLGGTGRQDLDFIKQLVKSAAINNGVPEELFKKLIQTESDYNPNAKSSQGAMGLGQIMPGTAGDLGLNMGDSNTPGSVWHPESNLDASARYFRKLYDKYQKDGIAEEEAWSFAAGAYNAGMGNIDHAIKKVPQEPVTVWDQVAQVLPQVTGNYSKETIRYVDRLRA